MPHPQTIQIFLPGGDPQGIRVASITTRILQVIEVPRICLSAFLAMPEADYVGVYALLGENEETSVPKAYIGQTGNFRTRLKQHSEKKDFWNRALISLSMTQSLTVTHAYYLEWLAIGKAARAERFELENGTAGSKPHTPPAMEAECREVFETLDILFTTLGYPLFEPLLRSRRQTSTDATPVFEAAEPSNISSDEEGVTVYCLAPGVEGQARYTEEGLVVLSGSYGRSEVSDSFSRHNYYRKRQNLIDQGALRIDGSRIVYTRDTLFKSPSPGAVYLLGRSANGWFEWKDRTGRSLADVMERKQ
nr:GIY-YIG nuclease family protein [Acetobacter nitrogenifigens]